MSSFSRLALLLLLLFATFVNSEIISVEDDQKTLQKKIYGAANQDQNQIIQQDDDQNQNDGNKNLKKSNQNSKNGKGKKWGLDLTWEQFKETYGLSYMQGAEDRQRKKNWEKNKKDLENSKCQQNCGVNEMFVKNKDQIQNMFGLRIGKPSFLSNEPMYFDTPENPQLSGTPLLSTPTSIDWRELGIVTPVKNQGSCGSCWAFAAVAFLESEFIKRNKVANTLNLAEHFLMQCDTKSANCDGGNPFSAAALGVAKGMPNEASMPYKIGYDYSSSYCSSPKIRSRFKQSGSITSTYSSTNNTRDTGIINFLQYRPVILGLEASQWYLYKPDRTLPTDQKVFKCSQAASKTNQINHAVLLVGFTSTYWIIKNSWGRGWGDKGYIYISRDENENCGIGKWYGSLTTTV